MELAHSCHQILYVAMINNMLKFGALNNALWNGIKFGRNGQSSAEIRAKMARHVVMSDGSSRSQTVPVTVPATYMHGTYVRLGLIWARVMIRHETGFHDRV